MEGIGADKDRIIKEIITHSNSFRQLVKEKYLTLYGKVKLLNIKCCKKIHFLYF